MKILREYQAHTRDLLANGGLNASGLGAGKTVTSVEAVRTLRLGRLPRVLVIAPVNTLRQWEATFSEQYPSLPEQGLTHVVGTHHRDEENWSRMTKRTPGVFIIGWNAMHGGIPEDIRRKVSSGRNALAAKPKATKASALKAIREGKVPPWTRTGTWDLVIVDEVHRAVNRDGVPRHVLKCIKAARWLALSATPGGNKPWGLWTVLNLLWPDRYSSFWGWVEAHFEIEEDEFYKGGKKSAVKKIGRELRPGGIWDDIPAAVRYRTEDVVDELPPVIERVVAVPMAPAQREQYEDFENQCLAWLSDQPVATPIPLEQRIRLRQAALGTLRADEVVVKVREWAFDQQAGDWKRVTRLVDDLEVSYEEEAEQPKLDAVREILADLPEGEALLVWTHSAKWARMAEKALGVKAAAWTNKTTPARRRKIEDGFGTQWRVLIAQTQSIGEGVDWLKNVCRCEVIVSPSEDEVMNQQAEGRLHRPGQKSPVQRWRLVSEDTIDDEVNLNNLLKRARMGSLYKDKEKRDAPSEG